MNNSVDYPQSGILDLDLECSKVFAPTKALSDFFRQDRESSERRHGTEFSAVETNVDATSEGRY